MRFDKICVLGGLLALAAAASAQPSQSGNRAPETKASGVNAVPRIEVSVGYAYLHANAPPGACQCFSLNGGYGSIVGNLAHGYSLVADMSAAHASGIVGTTQSLTVIDYLFGPRYSWRHGSGRFTPYGEALFGDSTQASNAVAIPRVTAFAFGAGGGVNAVMSKHLGWNVVNASWIHSELPNGVNNRQNVLKIESGVIFRF
jgi:hypothetical protein